MEEEKRLFYHYNKNHIDKLKKQLETQIEYIDNSHDLTNTQKESKKRMARISYSDSLKIITNLSKTKTKLANSILTNIIVENKAACLLVGINYFNTKYQLYGCINDSNMLRQFFMKSGFKNIITLTDDKSPKPTKTNIISKLTSLLKNSKEGDLIIFTYSGHGSYIIDRNNDENDNRDEFIIACDYARILDDEIKQIIHLHLKKNVTLFALFDCCHSGTILDLKYQYMDSTNYDKDTINDKNLDTPGNVIMISGCMDNQYSEDANINNKYQGAMTWSFLESLKTLKNSTWRELVKNMRTLLKKEGYSQIPQLSCGRSTNVDTKIIF